MNYKEILKNKILESIKDIERPCFVSTAEIAERVKELWNIQGIEITPDRIGKVMRNEGFASHNTGQKRGWIIF